MLTYPAIDRVAFEVGPVFGFGPLKVHWYGLMYVAGFLAAWWLARRRAARPGSTWKPIDVDDLIFFAAVGAQAPDHPVHPAIEETRYLRAFLFRVVDAC